MRLNCEQLEHRDVPSTLADDLPFYAPGYDPVPGADPAHTAVVTAKLGTAPDAPVYDIFFATGSGMGARVVIRDTQTGATVADRIVFADDFRGGVESVVVIGTHLFASPGDTGGPVIADFDLGTFTSRTLPVTSYPADWRGGLNLSAADVDATASVPVIPGGEELLVLPGSQKGGPVLLALDPTTGANHIPPILFGDAGVRDTYTFVPAGVQIQVSAHQMGCGIQRGDDPQTTILVGWDGVVYPDPARPADYAAA